MTESYHNAQLADIPELQALFVDCIKGTCTGDYSPAEIEAWLSSIKNQQRWTDLVEQQQVIMLKIQNQLAGFASLKDSDYLDFIYVSPNFQGKGIAKKLLAKITELALEAGAEKLISDISITARPFFESRGYTVLRENRNIRGDQVLINYRMEKAIKKNPDHL